jgi:hypothetical protein
MGYTTKYQRIKNKDTASILMLAATGKDVFVDLSNAFELGLVI